MARRICLEFAILTLGALSGCGSEKSNEHPPFCTDPSCVPTISPRVDTSSGGADGVGGDSSLAAGTSGAVVTVRGQVVDLDEPSFAMSSLATASGNFTVRAPTAGGAVFETNVTSIFSLDGVARSSVAWLTAKPMADSDLLPGLVVFDATTATNVTIPVVHRRGLELVGSVLTTPTTLDPQKAQVVLRFVDVDGFAVSGITVAMTGTGRSAYDLGGSYTDDAKGTSSRGLAFLFNVDASATPAARSLGLSGTVTGEIAVWVQAGTTTALSLAVSKH